MSYDNSGILGRNDKREKETHPEFTGSATIDGQDYWISGWVKEKNGRRFFSLAFKQKQERAPKPEQKQEIKPEIDDDNDLPF